MTQKISFPCERDLSVPHLLSVPPMLFADMLRARARTRGIVSLDSSDIWVSGLQRGFGALHCPSGYNCLLDRATTDSNQSA